MTQSTNYISNESKDEIDDVNDLDIEQIQKFERVAITAGASTPTYLINQVIYCLENNIQEKQIIEKDKIL